jgi:hypothetical protein
MTSFMRAPQISKTQLHPAGRGKTKLRVAVTGNTFLLYAMIARRPTGQLARRPVPALKIDLQFYARQPGTPVIPGSQITIGAQRPDIQFRVGSHILFWGLEIE